MKPTAPPVTISDDQALATTGLTPRQFRAALRELGVPHAKIGRRTVCRVDAWLAAVDKLAGATPRRPSVPWDEEAAIQRAAAR